MFRGVLCATLCVVLAVSVGTALAGQAKEKTSKPGIYAHFETSEGSFTVKFFEKEAPKTVANFVGLAEGTIEPITGKPGKSKPFYDGLTFHRVMDGFMIQSGDPTGTGTGGVGYRFADEFNPKLRFTKAGIVGMANIGEPNTNGSQFFVTLGPQQHLNDKHSIFGEVIEGMDVVVRIGKVKTGPGAKPLTPVIMKKVTIERVPAAK